MRVFPRFFKPFSETHQIAATNWNKLSATMARPNPPRDGNMRVCRLGLLQGSSNGAICCSLIEDRRPFIRLELSSVTSMLLAQLCFHLWGLSPPLLTCTCSSLGGSGDSQGWSVLTTLLVPLSACLVLPQCAWSPPGKPRGPSGSWEALAERTETQVIL